MTAANPNQDQVDFWSKTPGQRWSENDHVLDATLQPVLEHLLEVANLQPGERVLDIGCGTGLSTIEAAKAVGPKGYALGVDIAEHMLVKARAHATGVPSASFAQGDAQLHAFDARAFDVVISRFGVMFFADSSAAFANIARAVRPGGRMVFMTWSSAEENPWFSVPRAVATERLGEVVPTPPNAPGPMGLADRAYTKALFEHAGLSGVAITPVAMDLTPPGSARSMAEFALTLGPASRILADKDGTAEDAEAIVAGIAQAYAAHDTPYGLRIPAVLNRIEVNA